MCSLSTSDFKLVKSVFLTEPDVSTFVLFLKSDLFGKLDKSNSSFTFVPKISVLGNIHSFIPCLFLYPAIKRVIVSFLFNI